MKKILGLDLGTTSIGWALVNEAEEGKKETSGIIDLGARVIQYDNFNIIDHKSSKIKKSKNIQEDFSSGKSLSPNSLRTKIRGARRNLQRFKLRREHLIQLLRKHQFITNDTPLTEIGEKTTHQTLGLRAKAVKEKVELEDFAKVLFMINKKRGYKSSRKATGDNEGQTIDSMDIAKTMYEENRTPGQYVYQQLLNKKGLIPDFYRSDLQNEFDAIWKFQQVFYPEFLTHELYEKLQGEGKRGTSSKILAITGTYTAENKGSGKSKRESIKLQHYKWRSEALEKQLTKEEIAYVLVEINNNLSNSSGYLGNISDRSKALYFNNKTVGEYLYEQLKKNPHTSLKNQVFYRQDYLDEFETLWETQAKYHKELTPELKEEIRDTVIFYQRKLKSQKGLISFCQFESWEEDKLDKDGNIILNKGTGNPKKRIVGQRVIPKSSPLFQEFKIWSLINNLEFINKKTFEIKNPSEDQKQLLFKESNLGRYLKSNDILKLVNLKPREWGINLEEGIQGNKTNEALYNVYEQIAISEGYGHNWKNKTPTEIQEELRAIFPTIGIDTSILDFKATSENCEQQASYQLWHLLYATEDDTKISSEDSAVYGQNNVTLKKNLEKKFGIKPTYGALFSLAPLLDNYGSLSSRAIKKIIPFLEEGHNYYEACNLADPKYNNSKTKEEKESEIKLDKLDLLPKNSLRNPVVEKILNQMVNVVNELVDEHGKPAEIRIELARELKKTAKQRATMTSTIDAATKRNDGIKQLIQHKFGIPNPTKNDVIRYRLWEELKDNDYRTLFTDTKILEKELFTKEIDIEHIIPKAVFYDDSFSNKTLAYRKVNQKKGKRLAYDFIEQDYSTGLEAYKARVNHLYNQGKGAINKAKYLKLLKKEADLENDFTASDLKNTQYIAKKAKEMLETCFKEVHPVTGKITDKLRQEWNLTNVMKELNLPKYKALGLTSIEKRLNKASGKLKELEVITDWNKRNDHRHHAMDALTVAFTTKSHVQYFNTLNASEDTIKKEKVFTPPLKNFRQEAKKHLEGLLISFKAKNKVVTKNLNRHKTGHGENVVEQLTPRGQLHKETIYGKSKRPLPKKTKINKKFTYKLAQLIVHPQEKEAVCNHLEKYNCEATIAFDTKTLKKDPLLYKDEPLKEVTCFEEIFTIRKEIGADLKIEKVVDPEIREILSNRLKKHNNDPKKAFSDLEKDPIWLKKPDKNSDKIRIRKGIAIKRVTITGISNAESLHDKKDHLGNPILDEKGNKQAVDYVQTGNNHHVAIYKDADGNLQEKVVSFYKAVVRAKAIDKQPIIDKTYNEALGWEFLFTMKQNEMFVFPSDDFDPSEIDLFDPKNAALISKHLFRVQKISTKDYWFAHHLETKAIDSKLVKEKKQLNGKAYHRIQNTKSLNNLTKVRINHIGRIVHVGEY